jgi:fatty-acyl-CoA synthase
LTLTPSKTAKTTHPTFPLWRTVGDIGCLDQDGYLFPADRKELAITSGGLKIYPKPIENVLALHPKLADVAVIGLPNLGRGSKGSG